MTYKKMVTYMSYTTCVVKHSDIEVSFNDSTRIISPENVFDWKSVFNKSGDTYHVCVKKPRKTHDMAACL